MTTPNKTEKHGSVIVTGGGRGIGAAVSRLVGAHGYPVAVNFIKDETAAAAVVRDIVSAGGHAIAVQGNVGREEDILRLFETAERELGPIEGLVNNAAVTGGFARVRDLTASALAEVLTINIAGAMLCAREAVRRMSIKSGGTGGTIVNISSIAAGTGAPGEWVHYRNWSSRRQWRARPPAAFGVVHPHAASRHRN
jgi:NAD(P)-dependent dehydrogenase (short-subunit alcohol dehydrogenase family)